MSIQCENILNAACSEFCITIVPDTWESCVDIVHDPEHHVLILFMGSMWVHNVNTHILSMLCDIYCSHKLHPSCQVLYGKITHFLVIVSCLYCSEYVATMVLCFKLKTLLLLFQYKLIFLVNSYLSY